jgi:hypothetical protein
MLRSVEDRRVKMNETERAMVRSMRESAALWKKWAVEALMKNDIDNYNRCTKKANKLLFAVKAVEAKGE